MQQYINDTSKFANVSGLADLKTEVDKLIR